MPNSRRRRLTFELSGTKALARAGPDRPSIFIHRDAMRGPLAFHRMMVILRPPVEVKRHLDWSFVTRSPELTAA